jgi:Xaa-Pro aminopeptidase
LIDKLHEWIPGFGDKIIDVTYLVEEARRIKDEYEIGLIHNATQLTMIAQEAAAKFITPEKYEYEVQALVEYVFQSVAGAVPAFPSIVATGKNTTVLHCTDRTHQLKEGDLVVVDIGAEYGNYAADITRTYPVSGVFTDRQRMIYQVVLETQAYTESIVVPGMFVRNDKQPEKSLHHHAVKFLQKAGYDKYFYHGVSHFLGLDVHDVGSFDMPLAVGDVFTIEPGIYIPEENIGVRIEDDYVLVDDGVVCLSNDLVKAPADIEALIADRVQN